jgi:hypothetical protein
MRILAGIGGLAILAAVAVAIFFLGGFYSVAGLSRTSPTTARRFIPRSSPRTPARLRTFWTG